MVASRRAATGTHEGELMGIAPTHKRATVSGISIDRIDGGRIAEKAVDPRRHSEGGVAVLAVDRAREDPLAAVVAEHRSVAIEVGGRGRGE